MRLAQITGVPLPGAIVGVFLVAQVWDGVLTLEGLRHFGPSAEGNPLLAAWMSLIGAEWTLIGAKIFASLCGILLYCLGAHRVLFALTLFYGVFALGPWLMIFSAS